MVLTLRIMRITEVSLKCALRLCHLLPCYNAGTQEQPDVEQDKSLTLTRRLQPHLPHWLGILGHCKAAPGFFPCPVPLLQMQAARLLWELCWVPGAREQEGCSSGGGAGPYLIKIILRRTPTMYYLTIWTLTGPSR